jgi:hypothetical protein
MAPKCDGGTQSEADAVAPAYSRSAATIANVEKKEVAEVTEFSSHSTPHL